ncbi:FAD-binding protein [Glarea lozoyensis ATCC 20868]|uniref:FAD-binding protein n=1 Tax=Glarea lozoyensis (strain ATCC 20868 / MF5171) TaxID=1116229 RepID=S3D9D9_GLAL2|nr:FAD-binding protein [Glarea lozoyensis ATCC 20868]EPE35102.1 FAD-binding protein [Glarea lozoyensis ATCC 20868]
MPHISTPLGSTALAACANIRSAVQADVYSLPAAILSPEYLYAKTHYWSAANADRTPACVVFPTTAKEVSEIVQVLLGFPDVPFAIKSGGHNSNTGFASTDGGVLISFKNWNTTTLSDDGEVANVPPGARWVKVMTDLEPHGKAVVGGRIGDVGVGLLLGGGLSFLSTSYGMAADTVVEYEVVLANATIINANAKNNSDIFWALKGGGNQFGIVTKYTMKAITLGQVWGGVRIYSAIYAKQLLEATQHWTENFNDPKGSIIVTGDIAADSVVDIFVVFLFYAEPSPPVGVFDKFNSIPWISDTTRTQSFSSLLDGNSQLSSIYGLRWFVRGATVPNLPGQNGTDLYISAYNLFKSYLTNQGLERLNQLGFVFSLAFQPFPYVIPAAGLIQNPGGTPMNLDAANGDKMLLQYSISWPTNISDAKALEIISAQTPLLETLLDTEFAGQKSSHYVEGSDNTDDGNSWVFFNDAMYDQNPLQSYGGDSYNRLKVIQRRADPLGFFPSRTGGFKYI